MCGIAGIVDSRGRPIELPLVEKMAAALQHRGPDDEGIVSFPLAGQPVPGRPTAVLASRRLSILDLVTGRQPIANEDRTVWTVFNGEIYNFQELHADLASRGHVLTTASDTEVVVHLYEELGDEFVHQLNGMFALAVWDDRGQRLLLVRDRLGKKPLFYALVNGRLLFASELSALVLDPGLPRDLDLRALDDYLTYLAIPAPRTIYRAARKLPPGHLLVFERGALSIRRYWDLAFAPKCTVGEAEAAERLASLLSDAVRRRLVSDVPLGALLSGGVDSSLVVALMTRHLDRPVKTFSIGFEEADYNELPYARMVADRFGCDHHEFVVRPQALEVLPTLVERFGEPFADSSAIPTYYLARLTRQHVTVALNGDGGDELFAGYGRHLANRLAERCRRLPPGLRGRWLQALLGSLPSAANGQSAIARFRRFLAVVDQGWPTRYERWVGFFTTDLKESVYADVTRERVLAEPDGDSVARLFFRATGLGPVDAMLLADTAFYLPTDLLVKMDIMTMANSLEARSPFLDHRLVEFVGTLPEGFKLKGMTSKALLKRAFGDLLPREIFTRPKHGFAVPIARWFRGELRELLQDVLLSPRFFQRGYFRRPPVEALVSAHLTGQADYAHHLWVLLMLELWHRAFIDGPPR